MLDEVHCILAYVGWETHHPHRFHSRLQQPLLFPFPDEYVGIKLCFRSYEYYSDSTEDYDEFYEEVWSAQKQEVMLDYDKALDEFSSLLSHKGIPGDDRLRIINGMVNYFITKSSDYSTEIEKTVPVIVFEIIIETWLSYNEEEAAAERAIEESMEADDAYRSIPAAECAVRALEKVILDPAASNTRETTCTICLENLHPGSQVTRMPCSHMFHGDCIVQWLEISHVCPLCRFQMPTDQLSQCCDEEQEICT